jgi:histidinol-phosphatase
LLLAHQLADLADEISLGSFDHGVVATSKADGSPVTETDVEVERQLINVLAGVRPADGVVSEEGGRRPGSKRRWIIDPIDGTVNFVAGHPQWGTHVALEEDGEIVLGIVTRPVLGQRWWATKGGGAHHSDTGSGESDRTLRVSTCDVLAESRVTGWPPEPSPERAMLRKHAIWIEPDFTLLAQLLDGELDVIIARAGSIWDHAPGVILTEEAGGRFRDLDGGRRLDTGGGIYTNGRVDHQLLHVLDVRLGRSQEDHLA